MRRPKLTHILPFLAAIVLAALVMAGYKSEMVRAAPDHADPVNSSFVQVENSDCLFCHNRRFTTTFPNGEKLLLTIDEAKFNESVHGENQVACADCHPEFTTFPHPDLNVNSVREFSTTSYTTCEKCHAEQYNNVLDSVHQRALASGNINAAVCSDCHDPHEQKRITDEGTGEILPTARLHIPETCAQCHSAIYDQYQGSVHGKALTEEDNVDVPTCIDCHGVHNIQDPTTVTFHNSTPALCARCHTDPTVMDKYGLNTDVLDTYVADFHGSTVKLFVEQYPDQPTNKPVCTDCHGIHDIVKVDDPQAGIALKENLLGKCQRCHPDATTNFSGAWMSHYFASPTQNPLVYYVNLFYRFFIPAVLGGMTLFVMTDIYRRIVNRRKGNKHA